MLKVLAVGGLLEAALLAPKVVFLHYTPKTRICQTKNVEIA